ncbi:MAG: NAD(P)/FAD-dependent oxidoreductase [Haloferacaceae archaeon]
MRVAVLGAGYAGLTLAGRLEDLLPPEADLVVVDESGYHLVQHELHRLVRRPDLADAVTVPLSEALDRATVRTARVERIDRAERTIHLDGAGAAGTAADGDPDDGVEGADGGGGDREGGEGADGEGDAGDGAGTGDRIDYDYAAVCLGAETAFYGLPGVAEHAVPLKRIDHAERIREAALGGGRLVVGGAGLSGIQVAGELAALADEEGVEAEVCLLEREPHVAPTFPEAFRRAVRQELGERGVTVRTDAPVTGATADAVALEDDEVPYDAFVWTGGIRGPSATGGDRPTVRGDLRLDGRTFALGDAARVVDGDGEPVPASAAAAVRQARVAAANIVRLVEHDLAGDGDGDFAPRLDPYRFDVPGWIVSVGDGAVAQVGPAVVRGRVARAMKATVGAGHLSSVGDVRRAVELVESELHG